MSGFTKTVNVTICGGGNGGHVLAYVSSMVENTNVTLFDINKDKIEKWKQNMSEHGFTVNFKNKNQRLHLLPEEIRFRLTSDPADMPLPDIVILVMPAFLHEMYLNVISPYLEDSCAVIGLPGHPGFEYQALNILKEHGRKCTIMSTSSLPWSCRIVEYGQEVNVVGAKQEMFFTLKEHRENSSSSSFTSSRLTEVLQALMGYTIKLMKVENILNFIFLCRPTFHAPIMYARWRKWDDKPLDSPPLFYQSVGSEDVTYLQSATEEMRQTRDALALIFPDIDIWEIPTMHQLLINIYKDQIAKNQSLLSCLQTNKAFDHLYHPMKKTLNGKYIPDFNHRFLTEEVPYNLLIVRHIAECVGVQTPVLDEIIEWGQTIIGTEFLRDSKVCQVGREHTRLPFDYGINSIEELIHFLD